MTALGAAGLLLRRLRGELGVVVLIAVLVGGTAFGFAAAPRAFNNVSDAAVRQAVGSAPPFQRNVAINVDANLGADPDGGVAVARSWGDRLAEPFPDSLESLITDRTLLVSTVRFFVPKPPIYDTRITLRYQDGVTDATRLVDGRWPVDRGLPLRVARVGETAGGPEPVPATFEIALSKATADEIGTKLGGRLDLTLDTSDVFVAGSGSVLGPTTLEVVGLYEPLDPNAEAWSGDRSLLVVTRRGPEEEPIVYVTAYVAAETYSNLVASSLPFHYEWRFRVDPERLDDGRVRQLREDLRGLGVAAEALGPVVARSATVRTGLGRILDRHVAEQGLAASILSIAALGPLGLAGGAMAMVALLLIGRRRAALALARGRGASGSMVLGTQLWESVVISGGAALVGLLLATLLVPARGSPLSPAAAFGVAGAATLLLLASSWSVARRPPGSVERPQVGQLRGNPRRIVAESTIVLLAVAAILLLRQRGLTTEASEGRGGYDPLLAFVPILAGLAAGTIALRLYPLPLRLFGSLAAGRRDLVPVLGLRMIGRQAAGAGMPLLVLLLTAAFGTFASVVATSLERGQFAASYLDVGADYRVEGFGVGSQARTLDYRTIPGIEAAATGIGVASVPFSTGPSQLSLIYLEAFEPDAYRAVIGGSPGDPGLPPAFVRSPTEPPGTDDYPIPAILSTELPIGSSDLRPGDTFTLAGGGRSLRFRVIERRDAFPGIDAGGPFAVVPLNWLEAAFGEPVLTSIVWLKGSRDAGDALEGAVAAAGGAKVISRYDTYTALHDEPLEAAIGTGFAVALVVAGVYMALAIVGAIVLAATSRTRDLAYLRTLGVTARQALALTLLEHLPPVLLAIVPGVILGIVVAQLSEPGLGLATFVGATGVPLFVDWTTIAILVGALLAVVAVAVAAGTWLSRRAGVVDALRIGEH